MLEHAIAVSAALAGAVFTAVSSVVRQRATMDVPEGEALSAIMLSTLVRRPLWWIGTGSAVVGYAFQALALAYGSIIVVAPLLVSALLFALPLSARMAGRRVKRSDWGWALVLTVSLAVFVALARTRPGDYEGAENSAMQVAAGSGVVVIALVIAATRRSDWRGALLLAIGVGVLFGVVAVLTKIVMHSVTEGQTAELVTSPLPYILIAAAVVATLLQQSAFHAGSLQTSVPAMLVLEPIVAVLLGQIVLEEHLMVSRPAAAALGAAVLAMAAATIALGRDEGAYEDELEAAARRPAS